METAQFEALHVKPKPGRALVVGSHVYTGRPDRRQLYADAVGVDMVPGEGVDVVLDMEEEPPPSLGQFTHVDCISVLEHARRPWLVAANIERLLEQDGTLYLSMPFAWRIHAYPNDYWRASTEGVQALFPNISWKALQFVPGTKAPLGGIQRGGIKYFPRTETCGFGVRV